MNEPHKLFALLEWTNKLFQLFKLLLKINLTILALRNFYPPDTSQCLITRDPRGPRLVPVSKSGGIYIYIYLGWFRHKSFCTPRQNAHCPLHSRPTCSSSSLRLLPPPQHPVYRHFHSGRCLEYLSEHQGGHQTHEMLNTKPTNASVPSFWNPTLRHGVYFLVSH